MTRSFDLAQDDAPFVLTQCVWLHAGGAEAFEAFESVALARLSLHGAELLLRVRLGVGTGAVAGEGPGGGVTLGAALGGALDPPDELHLVRFPGEAALQDYLADPERVRVLPLRDASVRRTTTFRAPG